MKKYFLWVLALIIGAQSFAQGTTSRKAGLLWEISGKGLASPSYLFGTYHLAGKSFLDTLPNILACFNRSKTIVGEVVMDDEMEMARKMMPYMLLQNNTLDKLLTKAEFAEVDSFFVKTTGIQLSNFNGLKPAAVQVTLISFLAPKDISADNPAMDMFFQKEGKQGGKQVQGLETMEFQAGLLFNVPLDRQKEMLLQTVRESGRLVNESKELFRDYTVQNLGAVEKAFLENEDYTPEELDAMLTRRNRNWVDQIPGMMKEGPVFFAVGAGHLVGPKGLLALLKEAGYTLTPLAAR